MRCLRLLIGLAVLLPAGAPRPVLAAAPERIADDRASSFSAFLQSLWPDAEAQGVARPTFDGALRGLTPDPKVVALAKGQSEFSRPIWIYLAGAVSSARIAEGQRLGRRWAPVLDGIEAESGVPRAIILATWAMESHFGRDRGGFSVIRSLATLAHLGQRGGYFRTELIQALAILEADRIAGDRLVGSWAGAMGQTQFMPSSFRAYALDWDGDGRRDIWDSVPDVLASIANFLRAKGWQPGLPWGLEVRLPVGFGFTRDRETFAGWSALGLRRADGAALPGSGTASLLPPAGARGPAFLVTDNFEAIRAYNTSDAYALAIGLLADRIAGGAALRAAWPVGERVLDRHEVSEVQRRLAARGLYDGVADGRLGAKTRAAVRRFQAQRGLVPDGYAEAGLLEALRAP
jgi:membrane-bound lytic murein transglycosylase B